MSIGWVLLAIRVQKRGAEQFSKEQKLVGQTGRPRGREGGGRTLERGAWGGRGLRDRSHAVTSRSRLCSAAVLGSSSEFFSSCWPYLGVLTITRIT